MATVRGDALGRPRQARSGPPLPRDRPPKAPSPERRKAPCGPEMLHGFPVSAAREGWGASTRPGPWCRLVYAAARSPAPGSALYLLSCSASRLPRREPAAPSRSYESAPPRRCGLAGQRAAWGCVALPGGPGASGRGRHAVTSGGLMESRPGASSRAASSDNSSPSGALNGALRERASPHARSRARSPLRGRRFAVEARTLVDVVCFT